MFEIIRNPKRLSEKCPESTPDLSHHAKWNDSRNDSEKIFDFAHDAGLEEATLAREGR